MSERYSKLYTLPMELYTSGSPVLLSAGALLLDEQSGRVLAQLKFRSLSERAIQEVHIHLAAFDTLGAALGDKVEHRYMDLNVGRDQFFGMKTPIYLPDDTTRRFSVVVDKVIFTDHSIWQTDGSAWEGLPESKRVEEELEDAQLVRQYQLQYGSRAKYLLTEHGDLWQCTCGAWNRQGEETCHVCQTALADLRGFEREELQLRWDERLADEEKKAAEDVKKAKRTAKRATIGLAAVAAATLLTTNVIVPMKHYLDAKALLEDGAYWEAYTAYAALANFADSREKAEAILNDRYQQVYTQMNTYLDEKAYETACSYYEQEWKKTFGTVSADKATESSEGVYADDEVVVEISDTTTELDMAYAYADLLDRFEGENVKVNSYINALEELPVTYRDVSERINKARSGLSAYVGDWYLYSGSETYAISIKENAYMTLSRKYKYSWSNKIRSTTLESGYLKAKLEDGSLSGLYLPDGSSFWYALTLTADGSLSMEQKFNGKTYQSSVYHYNGVYTKK